MLLFFSFFFYLFFFFWGGHKNSHVCICLCIIIIIEKLHISNIFKVMTRQGKHKTKPWGLGFFVLFCFFLECRSDTSEESACWWIIGIKGRLFGLRFHREPANTATENWLPVENAGFQWVGKVAIIDYRRWQMEHINSYVRNRFDGIKNACTLS